MAELPARQGPPEPRWERFSADPRTRSGAELRASTADRDLVAEVLADAFASGRLDDDEYRERLDAAMQVRRLGEVMPLVQDLVPASSRLPEADRVGSRSNSLKAVWGSFAVVAIITNLVWLLVTLSSGSPGYYWPMWPMAGMIIPVIVMYLFPNRDDQ